MTIVLAPMSPGGPADPRPALVRHATLGLTWQVQEVLQSRVHPYAFSVVFSEPAVRRRYRLRVHGALPWRPGERGEFIMIICLYRDRPGWWASPA